MFKKIWNIYKVQFLVSIALAIVIISTNIIKTPLNISLVSLGALIGTFILEFDYFVYAYFMEPEKSFSHTLKAFVSHRDFAGALNHIYYNKGEVRDKTLNNVLFQIALAGTSIFVATSSSSIFVKVLVLSTFANSIYKMADYYFEGKSDQWFWSLKKMPTENGILTYGLVLVLVLVYSITLF